jgi:hypothetical protein
MLCTLLPVSNGIDGRTHTRFCILAVWVAASALVTPLAPIARAQAAGTMIVTEIMANPAGSDYVYEWIELYNPSSATVNLGQYYFRVKGKNHSIGPVQVRAHRFAILARNRAGFLARYPHLAAITVESSIALSNTGDLLEILKGTNYPADCVDSVDYCSSGYPPVVEGASIHLNVSPGPEASVDNDDGANWSLAGSGDGLSWSSSNDVANPGMASWFVPRNGSMVFVVY